MVTYETSRLHECLRDRRPDNPKSAALSSVEARRTVAQGVGFGLPVLYVTGRATGTYNVLVADLTLRLSAASLFLRWFVSSR